MALYMVITFGCKKFLKDENYKYVLALINVSYLFLLYNKPLHFFIFISYTYLITYLFTQKLKFKDKIWGILALLLPMLLVKFDIRFHFYPFELNNILSFAGLSYASFRIVSYMMDKAPDDKMANIIDYFNYLSFTPTLLIGPIDRFHKFKSSSDNGFSHVNWENIAIGWNALVKGIAFKFVIAEVIDRYWLNVYDQNSHALIALANNMYAYYFYLFFDFAGYSFMALGLGKMLGMQVPLNFGNPFLAVNPQDFWKKFHISLGDWLKDYFFTPLYLYLSRKKSLKKHPLFRQNAALVLTFLLMGCWNGFKANYILSGLLFGIYSAVHNTYVVTCKKKGKDIIFYNLNENTIKLLSIFITFNLVAFSLYIFSGRFPYLH
jgi:membrane protein involved in D-alanine export